MGSGVDVDLDPVTERSMEWMIVAISVMCFLVAYYCFVNRKSMFHLVTCSQQEKIIEVPQGDYKFDIAQPAQVIDNAFFEKAFVSGVSDSSICTAYTGVLNLEGNRSFETGPFTPLAVDEGDEETGNVSQVAPARPAGGEHYSRPSVEVTGTIGETYVSNFNVLDTGSPSAVEYVTPWGGVYPDSPTASSAPCSPAYTPKRVPTQGVHAMFRHGSAQSIDTASTAESVASQDLSGFAALSPKRHAGHSQFHSSPEAYNGPKRSVKAMHSHSAQSLDSFDVTE